MKGSGSSLFIISPLLNLNHKCTPAFAFDSQEGVKKIATWKISRTFSSYTSVLSKLLILCFPFDRNIWYLSFWITTMISIRLKFVNFCFCLFSLQVQANLSNIYLYRYFFFSEHAWPYAIDDYFYHRTKNHIGLNFQWSSPWTKIINIVKKGIP